MPLILQPDVSAWIQGKTVIDSNIGTIGTETLRVRGDILSSGTITATTFSGNVIQPITSIQSTGFTYTIPLIPLQTSTVYIPVAYAKSSGSAFNITISNGTSSVLINIPASSPTPTVSAITSTLFCDASGILTLQGDITSSGSNSNGSWIQFADGTMECWKNFGTTSAISSTLYSPYDFPNAGFISIGHFVMGFLPATIWGTVVSGEPISLTQYRYGHWNPSGGTQNLLNLNMHAIGRWK